MLNILRYLWEIFKEIPCNWKQKKRILLQVKKTVWDYVSDHPDAAYEDILDRFGTPRQIVTAYVEDMEVPELVDKLRFSGKIVRITAITATVAVLLWLGVVSIALIRNKVSADGQIDVSVTVEERIEITEE